MTPEATKRLQDWVAQQRAQVPASEKCADPCATGWHFDIQRDEDGLMSGVTAIPVPLPTP